MNSVRFSIALRIIICFLLAVGFPQASTGKTGAPIVLHRRIPSTNCDLLQRGSLMTGDHFAWIEPEGTQGQIYSPELEPDDYVTSLSGSSEKAARKSGFEVKKNSPSTPDLPAVTALSGEAHCPELQSAISDVEQRRAAKRDQLQSKIYGSASPGITPASVVRGQVHKLPPPHPANSSDSSLGSPPKKQISEGTVLLNAVIGIDGTIRKSYVVRPLNPYLDQKATEEVALWTFNPAMLKGIPVPE